ncbi:MAG: DinB family protein [Gemmatimonadales bacterium]
MTPDLQAMLADLEAIKADGTALCGPLTDAQFNWRPAPDRWSIAECLVHLNVSVTYTLPAFDRAIAAGRADQKTAAAAASVRYGWFSRWMIGSMEPPPKWRMPTVRAFAVPAGARHAGAEVLPRFLAVRDELAARVRHAAGLDLRRIKVVSPVNRLLRLPLGAYFQFVIAHDRRHLWQARQVRTASAFGQS